jgi:hypothetical protein
VEAIPPRPRMSRSIFSMWRCSRRHDVAGQQGSHRGALAVCPAWGGHESRGLSAAGAGVTRPLMCRNRPCASVSQARWRGRAPSVVQEPTLRKECARPGGEVAGLPLCRNRPCAKSAPDQVARAHAFRCAGGDPAQNSTPALRQGQLCRDRSCTTSAAGENREPVVQEAVLQNRSNRRGIKAYRSERVPVM